MLCRFLPNLLRNSIISATELVVYDTSKEALLEAGMHDGIGLHFSAGAVPVAAWHSEALHNDMIASRLLSQSTQLCLGLQGLFTAAFRASMEACP